MYLHRSQSRRRGTILPMLAISLVALVGFVALAIDISVIAVIKNQCQNAADTAAMTGARSLDGSVTANISTATTNAKNIAKANFVMNKAVLDSEVSIQFGAYHYDANTSTFAPQFPPVSPDTHNLAQATVTRYQPFLFAGVWGGSGLDISATAIAAHRPRDVCMVLDFSGSMNNESDLWNNEGYLGSVNNSPNNEDSVVPTFGQYSDSGANLVSTSGDARVGKCNVTEPVLGISALVDDFFSNDRSAAAVQAFAPASSSLATTPNGTQFLTTTQNTTSTFAQTVSQVVANTTWDLAFELDGYAAYDSTFQASGPTDYSGAPFAGYTEGPKYYGKTFMVWPPDPRAGAIEESVLKGYLREFGYTWSQVIDPNNTTTTAKKIRGIFDVTTIPGSSEWSNWPADGAALKAYLLNVPRPTSVGLGNLLATDAVYQAICRLHARPVCDWRAKFFLKSDGVTPLDDNTKLWDSSGNWRDPVDGSGNTRYIINYAAILNWIQNTGTNPFPSTRLRSGRILYYDSIPSDVPSSAYDWGNPSSDITDPTVRFWKEYIDYTLGVWRSPYGSIQKPGNPACSIAPDFTWGTIQVSGKPTTNATGHFLPQYMDYLDSPKRPRHRGWFGPMTMVQFISDTGQFPGTVHDISMYSAKLGLVSAIIDISNNHPNDMVSLLMYNRPHFNTDPSGVGGFSGPQFTLSRDYLGMQDALYFPPNSSSADVRPWDPNAVQTPRAFGDFTANTCTNFGLMMAYNQFSQNSTLQSGNQGGLGRKGSQRLVILETDGMANVSADPTFNNFGAYNSYYSILPSDSLSKTTSGSNHDHVVNAANQICALDTATLPGYSTPRKPVIIHCIAFGSVFETTAEGSEPDNALALLQAVAAIGQTGFPSSRTNTSDPNFYKLCTGTLQQRQDKLRTAFKKIMDDGVSVSLIQ